MKPMSRDELAGLGLTDQQLEELCLDTLGLKVSFAGDDELALQVRRRTLFEQSLARAQGLVSTRATGPKISAYAIDDPAAHGTPGPS